MTDISVVGSVGFNVATYLKEYLGYLAYVYVAVLLYPLYKINFSYINKAIEKTVAVLFLAVSIIITQSLLVKGEMSGEIGNIIVKSISPFIGLAGLWIFVFLCFVLSIIILFDSFEKSISLRFKWFENPFKGKFSNFFKSGEPKFSKDQNFERLRRRPVEKPEPKVVVKEFGDTAEIRFEDDDVYEPKNGKISKNINISEDIQLKQQLKQQPKQQNFDYENEIYEESLSDKYEDDFSIDDQNEVQFVQEKKSSHSLIVDELEENKKLLEDIEVGESFIPKNFQLPPTNIFQKPPKDNTSKINEEFIDRKIEDLLEKLKMFKIEGDVVRTYTGPIVTTFEFKPAPNVKVSKILNLQDDLAMALKATTIRIQAPIPGKDVVGIEVPNEETQTIYLREILESELFCSASSPLTMILGKDIVGKPFITDLKKLPHLLIAGTTGSGKSVGLNSMILSLLYKNSPDHLKLIMIDPKMLEFSIYNDIPHLLTPVITRPTEAINALANMVAEMEKRYAMMADTKTKNIENYNEKARNNGYEEFPYIVVIIDELADLMMTSGKEVELSIARLAQMARASGIHLIVATQRPSVDVVTGLIKANLPSRISYKVGQKVDSKIILDSMGAESLLGRGDMLFTPPGMSGLVRIHAPWSDEKEIEQVVEFLKDQREAQYDISFLKEQSEDGFGGSDATLEPGELDELYEQAKMVVLQDKKSSISYLQRRLKIGYNRSATIIEQLEKTGILSEPNAKGNRDILV